MCVLGDEQFVEFERQHRELGSGRRSEVRRDGGPMCTYEIGGRPHGIGGNRYCAPLVGGELPRTSPVGDVVSAVAFALMTKL